MSEPRSLQLNPMIEIQATTTQKFDARSTEDELQVEVYGMKRLPSGDETLASRADAQFYDIHLKGSEPEPIIEFSEIGSQRKAATVANALIAAFDCSVEWVFD